MPTRLDPNLLRTFVAVAEAGSLSRAGERLRLAQPTVSLQIKRLEDVLGCRLLERTPRSLRLTSEGETLLGYGRRILALCEEALATLAEPAVTGLVRLGTPEDFATTHLPTVLAAFRRSHPNVALEVTTDLTLNLIERFRAGEFDVVLIKREPLGPSEGVRVWREALVWARNKNAPRPICGPRGHPVARGFAAPLRLSAQSHAGPRHCRAQVARGLYLNFACRGTGGGAGGVGDLRPAEGHGAPGLRRHG